MVRGCGDAPELAEGGDRLVMVGTGFAPVPLRLTDCGLPGASSVTVIEAERFPNATGVNETEAEHCAPAASELPHVLLKLKSPGLVPPRTTLVMEIGVVPVLVRVTVCCGLLVPRT